MTENTNTVKGQMAGLFLPQICILGNIGEIRP